ncbi:hypothetical protein AYM40_10610 [Paraburkholderia phytofirmans OLGA172]|uniref:Uncharacterized protein n=1 Tax=Paraburkholderia phytofirmans OLGA172 TaxID=1417228 RepID=A0A161IB66_9BURK|nr:hypothetical protein AYM40_10610 [Paraburkholderia phytofirmans OLGA172]
MLLRCLVALVFGSLKEETLSSWWGDARVAFNVTNERAVCVHELESSASHRAYRRGSQVIGLMPKLCSEKFRCAQFDGLQISGY